MGDAIVVLLKCTNLPETMPKPQRRAIEDLKRMLPDIGGVKEQHNAKLVLWP